MTKGDLFALMLSFLYVAAIVLFAFFAYWRLKWKGESVRKFIHILTSCWVFILIYAMESPFCMMLGPVLFIFINGFFVYGGYGVLLGMGNRKRDFGLVYYPISLLILVILYWQSVISSGAVVTGVLVMGWGDGLAALVGSKWGKHRYKVYHRWEKSAEGSLAMVIVSFMIAIIFGGLSPLSAFFLALVATALESLTPLGFDNITVPLLTALLTEVLCLL